MTETKRFPARPLATRVITLAALITRPMIMGVRGLVIDAQKRVLLVRHSYVAGYWLPGGGVEHGETLLDALARELREEGNIVLSGEAPVLHGVYLNRDACRYNHETLFVVRGFRQTGPFAPTREIVEAGFFPADALPEDAIESVRKRIDEVMGGVPTSPYW
ncbi:NUDIX domain-containing protein [Methylocystis sp. IM2]